MNAETNKAIVRRLMTEAWGGGKVDDLADYVAVDNRHHVVGRATILFGPDQMRAMIANFRSAMPDFGCHVGHVIAEGDMVVLHGRFSGTQTQPFAFAGRTIPPSNRTMDVQETFTARIADGRIVETWATWDRLTLLEQLGVAV